MSNVCFVRCGFKTLFLPDWWFFGAAAYCLSAQKPAEKMKIFRYSLISKDSVKESRILNNKAHQKPETENPLIRKSASKMMMALITNKNNPMVRMVIGSVRSIKTGFTKNRRREIIIATKIADV